MIVDVTDESALSDAQTALRESALSAMLPECEVIIVVSRRSVGWLGK